MVRNVIEYNEYTSDELLKMKKSEAIERLKISIHAPREGCDF